MSIEIEGLDHLIYRLDTMTDTQNLEKSMERACLLVERSAKQRAEKDTGDLRRSITSKVEVNDDEVIGVIYTPLEYAPYVEYGTGLFAEKGGRQDVPWSYQDDKDHWHTTSGQKPQPYLRPALNQNKKKIDKFIMEGIMND